MSVNITTAMIEGYKSGVEALFQQKTSVFEGTVRTENQEGKWDSYDQLGATSAYQVTGRHADTRYVDSLHYRRWVQCLPYAWADLIDNPDKLRVLTDPTNPYAESAVMAMNRAKDTMINAAFWAAAQTGVASSTGTTSYDTDYTIACAFDDGSTAQGMTLNKWIEAKRLLDANEVPRDGRHIAFTSKQLAELLNVTEVGSSDYNSVKALVYGEIDQFLGFQVHRYESLSTDSSSYRKCPFWHESAMLLAKSQEISVKISELPTKNYSVQVYVSMDMGATRLQEKGVGCILCSEA